MDLSFGNNIRSSLKLTLQLFLLGLFLHIFGLPALDRYLDKKVMVVKSMEKADDIPIPAITIVVDGAADEFGCILREDVSCVTCNHAMQRRNIPIPDGWAIALQAARLPRCATLAGQHAAEHEDGFEFFCHFLGMPKPLRDTILPATSGEAYVGSIVYVKFEGGGNACEERLLCARIDGDLWLCHPGSHTHGVINAQNPFDSSELVVTNVRRDVWPDEADWKQDQNYQLVCGK